jgi:hypothetical protein
MQMVLVSCEKILGPRTRSFRQWIWLEYVTTRTLPQAIKATNRRETRQGIREAHLQVKQGHLSASPSSQVD